MRLGYVNCHFPLPSTWKAQGVPSLLPEMFLLLVHPCLSPWDVSHLEEGDVGGGRHAPSRSLVDHKRVLSAFLNVGHCLRSLLILLSNPHTDLLK